MALRTRAFMSKTHRKSDRNSRCLRKAPSLRHVRGGRRLRLLAEAPHRVANAIPLAAAAATLLLFVAVSCGPDGEPETALPSQTPTAASTAAVPTPTVAPDEPVTVPDEPVAEAATPTPVPDESVAEAATPTAVPDEPMAEAATPTAVPDEPGTDVDEPATAADEPEAESEEPAATDEPGTNVDEATAATDDPAAETDDPAVDADESDAETDDSSQVAVEPTPTPVLPEPDRSGDEPLAPELRNTGAWINSEPFTLESRRGEVVLIDFWTFSCVNCIRTLPYLKSWHDKYADSGLVLLGVHAPEFEFEHVLENVQEAVDEFGLLYPIVQDNERGTWRAFRNRFWPAKYLIDRDGYIRYTHFGEGRYAETEQWIRKLLEEAGADLSGISDETEPGPVVDPEARKARGDERRTRELYAGFRRNINALTSGNRPPYILQPDYFSSPGEDVLYFDNLTHQNNYLYLEGLWRSTDESIVHARDTEGFTDYVAILFYATQVNAVMSPTGTEPFTVRLVMDEAPLTPDQAGVDVTFDSEGNSIVIVDEARMYNLIELASYGGHELTLSSDSDEMQLFTFTFGAYDTGR